MLKWIPWNEFQARISMKAQESLVFVRFLGENFRVERNQQSFFLLHETEIFCENLEVLDSENIFSFH